MARKDVPNDLAACIIAIEGALGVDPQGSRADVKTYLQTEHTAAGIHDSALVGTISGDQTFTGDKTFTGDVQGIPMLTGFSNLKAQYVTTTTFTITADYVYFASPASPYNGHFALTHGFTYTNTITVDNTALNGRDQLTAFTLSSWIHVYLICNSSTGAIATLSSATAPVSGPALPTDYDMWAYVGPVYLDASIHVTPMRIRNNHVYYDVQQATSLDEGDTPANSATAVSIAALVPPNANEAVLLIEGLSAASATRTFTIEHVTGSVYYTLNVGQDDKYASAQVILPLTTAQTFYYLVSSASDFNVGVWVHGFTIPNGAR